LALSIILVTVPMSVQYETALCPAVQAPCILYTVWCMDIPQWRHFIYFVNRYT